MFSHFVTFGRRLFDSVLLSDCLGPLRGRLPVCLSRPPLGSRSGPRLQSDPFCVESLIQDGFIWVRSGPGPFWGLRRASTVLGMLLWLRCRSNLSRNSSVRAAPLRFIFSFFLNFCESCLYGAIHGSNCWALQLSCTSFHLPRQVLTFSWIQPRLVCSLPDHLESSLH